jgi:hypothetical protein
MRLHHVPVKPVVLVLLLAAILVSPAMAAGHWDITTVETGAASDNTDGLYTSIVIGKDNVPHASWVNEAKDQVEYGTYRNNKWTIERVGPIDSQQSGFELVKRDPIYYTFTTSIDLDPQGNPAISYAGIAGHLYFAHRETNGIWIIKDIAGSDTQKHQWSSLKYDPAGRPHVAFTTKTYVLDAPYGSHLSWAWQKDDKSWQVDTIDNPYENTGYEPALAFDSQNRATIVYRAVFNHVNYDFLKVARQDGNGSWEAFQPMNSCVKEEACGFHPSLALDSKGNAHFVHYTDALPKNIPFPRLSMLYCTNRVLNRSSHALSTNHGIQSWVHPTYHRIDRQPLSIDTWDSLAVDSADRTHVSYYDLDEKDLKYSYNDGDPVVVDKEGNVGRCNAIAVDSRGNPWIIYHDDTNNAVRVARWVPE